MSFMFLWPALVMHNANLVFMIAELWVNGFIVSPNHAPFAVLFGCAYIVFAWAWFARTGVFFYFFIDHTRPMALVSHAVLMAILWGYFVLGHSACRWIGKIEGML